MEEILSSIRKIISDDDAPDGAVEAEAADDGVELVDADESDFEEFTLDDIEPEVATLPEEEYSPFEEEVVAEEPVAPEPEPVFEAAEPEPVEAPPMAVPPMQTEESPAMAASPAYESTVLTEETTADAAAGALGKLISKMDIGGENTLEGMVRELLKPMMKEWLDDNLPTIVEEKVEAEVQRIARMAR
ncbi:MAG: DUF2497 domain-containing protein [Pseudomonadota bacterium]